MELIRNKNSLIDVEGKDGGLGTDSNNAYTFDKQFKVDKPKKEKKPKEKLSLKFEYRGIEFNGDTAPYFILMLLLIVISVILFVKGNISVGLHGIFLTVLTFLTYNNAYMDYDNNHNLLFWNVTTTLQALFKYTSHNLLICGNKILIIGALGSTLSHLNILSNINAIFVYMIIVGGFLTFIDRKTELLSVIFRSYGIMIVISLLIGNMYSLLKYNSVFLNSFDIATFLVIYTLGVLISAVEIEQPIEY